MIFSDSKANTFGIKQRASAPKEGKTSGTIRPHRYPVMDEEALLVKQEALLVLQIELVKKQLDYVRFSKSEHQKVISIPCSSSPKIETSPVQTETGKDKSKPLMVDALPKSIMEDSSSKNLATEEIKNLINLRPNQGIQIPKDGVKSADEQSSFLGIQIPNKDSKPYYVVFNGPNRGIFENWDIAKKATEGISNIKFKKYKSFLEAKTAANIYCREHVIPELQLIRNEETLMPATYSLALKKEKEKKISLGRLPQKNISQKEEIQRQPLAIKDFEYLYKHARLAGEEKLIEEKFFTEDKRNLSFFNFVKGANPEFVLEAFEFGLIKYIYPSQNLHEISLFPSEIYKAIKTFRTKVLKTNKDIFLKFCSSIPIWFDDTVSYFPHHIIQIGVSNGEKYSPSVPSACSLEKNDLLQIGKKKLEEFLNKAFSFTKEDKIFVNKESENVLIYSYSLKPISNQDEEKILAFQQRFAQGRFLPQHDKRLCPIVVKKTAVPCALCLKDESGPSTNQKEARSAEDDNSMPLFSTKA